MFSTASIFSIEIRASVRRASPSCYATLRQLSKGLSVHALINITKYRLSSWFFSHSKYNKTHLGGISIRQSNLHFS